MPVSDSFRDLLETRLRACVPKVRVIRDCILFPKSSRGADLMTGAPAAV